MAVSLLGIFNPASKALYNIWLYGGLALTSALVLFRTQSLLYNAKNQHNFDPLGSSVGFYLDAINFFVRFLAIMQGSKKK